MNKFVEYAEKCREEANSVNEAILDGCVLSEEELLDYYFKALISGSKMPLSVKRTKSGSLATYFSKVYKVLQEVSQKGYSNEKALRYFRKINFNGLMLLGKHSSSIEYEDRNGVLYMYAESYLFDAYKFSITGVSSLIHNIREFSEYLVSLAYPENDFYMDYLSEVIHAVLKRENPIAYVNLTEKKTLSYMINKETDSKKVIYLTNNYGGKNDGRDNSISFGRETAI